tara:strand:- start:196 stop:432 length:237 start_codon:yes stop_codon:yes gene_type:complete
MEISEYVFVGIGACFSIIGYFLKRENKRLESMEALINKINLTLAQNDVRDSERWGQVVKQLEDRRIDVRNLYDMVQKK